MSFFEMLDKLNNELIEGGEQPIAFDHDCREGICGTCGIVINGKAHGPIGGITSCQLHMRSFIDGDTIDFFSDPWSTRQAYYTVVDDKWYFTTLRIHPDSERFLHNSHYRFHINSELIELVDNELTSWNLEQNINKVAFDRSGFKYHGRLQVLADAARDGGIDF